MDLESKVLTVTEEKIIADLKRGVPAVTLDITSAPTYGAKSETLNPYEVLDDRLIELPSVFCGRGIDLWVEWMYTIDLDREMFSVNSRIKQVNFGLDNIPRDRWMLAFKKDDDGDEDGEDYESDGPGGKDGKDGDDEDIEDDGSNVSSFEIYPEVTYRYPIHAYFAYMESCKEYKAKYQSYSCCVVQSKVRIDTSSKTADSQILAVVMFEKLMSPSYLHLKSYLPNWRDLNVKIGFTLSLR